MSCIYNHILLYFTCLVSTSWSSMATRVISCQLSPGALSRYEYLCNFRLRLHVLNSTFIFSCFMATNDNILCMYTYLPICVCLCVSTPLDDQWLDSYRNIKEGITIDFADYLFKPTIHTSYPNHLSKATYPNHLSNPHTISVIQDKICPSLINLPKPHIQTPKS